MCIFQMCIFQICILLFTAKTNPYTVLVFYYEYYIFFTPRIFQQRVEFVNHKSQHYIFMLTTFDFSITFEFDSENCFVSETSFSSLNINIEVKNKTKPPITKIGGL